MTSILRGTEGTTIQIKLEKASVNGAGGRKNGYTKKEIQLSKNPASPGRRIENVMPCVSGVGEGGSEVGIREADRLKKKSSFGKRQNKVKDDDGWHRECEKNRRGSR